MTAEDHAHQLEVLHGLITSSGELKGFLDAMTGFAAETMIKATGRRVECALTLHRHKRSVEIAGSSDDAILLDGVGQRQGDGPRTEALRTGLPVLIADVSLDFRWKPYCHALAGFGCRSVLAVPLELGSEAEAALNFFAPTTGFFTAEVIKDARAFANTASQALRVELRIVSAELLAEDLKAAMESRTAIDLACGMIMAQNRCSQEEAFQILVRASSTRSEKLHTLAQKIVSNVSGDDATCTHFDD
ncbi:GAF and ANTAR domain-containing protein [Arthrobacter sp. ISL-85]|uniref:GAF and ANTAR domain-containing protein n=1 Tax=Arthrobacter sp. ISL-85 TaxID=2819115 RepID=UPI001BE69A97|nr:GAF and ANTAR domain-containing protein [Arthrobacter sp. ISL-85]MBT2566963.1 GAF and ANTAR domain-containing protein [Arthrobacter sp. ISL-85]